MLSRLDRVLVSMDTAMRTLFAPAQAARPSPAAAHSVETMTSAEQRISGRLMRVNHVGEVCAQALYQGQALTSRNDRVRTALVSAAKEEEDHLAWCEQRLRDLGSRKSLLNPLWYAGSFALGSFSGILGDKWNLAFLAETERQVEGHLQSHLDKLPFSDSASRLVLAQMMQDEARHAITAQQLGAADMPAVISSAMRAASRIMTMTAHWV